MLPARAPGDFVPSLEAIGGKATLGLRVEATAVSTDELRMAPLGEIRMDFWLRCDFGEMGEADCWPWCMITLPFVPLGLGEDWP